MLNAQPTGFGWNIRVSVSLVKISYVCEIQDTAIFTQIVSGFLLSFIASYKNWTIGGNDIK